MATLKVNFVGIELDNPIITSAGPTSDAVTKIENMELAGAGAIVLKSLHPAEEMKRLVPYDLTGNFPEARPTYAHSKTATMYGMTGPGRPLEIWAEPYRKLSKKMKVPFIGSSVACTLQGHIKVAKFFEEIGAAAFELCVSCPIIVPGQEMAGIVCSWNPPLAKTAVAALKNEISIPLGVKINPNPLDPIPLFRAMKEAGADFLHLDGTQLGASPVDIETGRPYIPSPEGGFIAGPGTKYGTLRWVLLAARSIGFEKIHFTASGGVMDWHDTVEFIMYGCTTVQMCNSILRNGPGIINETKNKLQKFMERKSYQSITDFRGMALKHLLQTSRTRLTAWEETKGKIVAEVDMEKCNLCGICERSCLGNLDNLKVITTQNKKLMIDQEKCFGCSNCIGICPMGALRMKNIEILFDFEKRHGITPNRPYGDIYPDFHL